MGAPLDPEFLLSQPDPSMKWEHDKISDFRGIETFYSGSQTNSTFMPPNMVCFPLPTQSPKCVALLLVETIERMERRMSGYENSVWSGGVRMNGGEDTHADVWGIWVDVTGTECVWERKGKESGRLVGLLPRMLSYTVFLHSAPSVSYNLWIGSEYKFIFNS